MPELPEVETIVRQLNKVLAGQRIVKIEVLSKKSFGGNPKDVEGEKIVRVWRRAKMAIVELASSYLLIHLKMTGQLVYDGENLPNKLPRPEVHGIPQAEKFVSRFTRNKHTRVVFRLSKGRLFFNDQRLFGWVKVVDKEKLAKEFKGYGPDVTDKAVTDEYFYNALQRSRRAVKLVICDQSKVGGVGNIYANDGLWCARVLPTRPASNLTREEAKILLACLLKVVSEGIKYGGATAADDKFVQATGLGGKYQEHFLVYEQAGKKCQRCKSIIQKMRLGGRGTYYCPNCQK